MTVSQKGSHLKMKHPHHSAVLIVPNHGSQELGKGLEMKIKKIAGMGNPNGSNYEK